MALSTKENNIEIEVICPWCDFKLFCKIGLGENDYRCSCCNLPFKIKIALSKRYEDLTEADKKSIDDGTAFYHLEQKLYP